MKKKQTIGWWIGHQRWAFANLTSHLIKAMPEYVHKINHTGDINILMSTDLLHPSRKRTADAPAKILHLDSNRWMEEGGYE